MVLTFFHRVSAVRKSLISFSQRQQHNIQVYIIIFGNYKRKYTAKSVIRTRVIKSLPLAYKYGTGLKQMLLSK